ncbi:hypothetical protein QJS66_13520 [Kocuria rhizophila]|nr:hypothetical protein QJS66_13520 [Kocuria rhizophila]
MLALVGFGGAARGRFSGHGLRRDLLHPAARRRADPGVRCPPRCTSRRWAPRSRPGSRTGARQHRLARGGLHGRARRDRGVLRRTCHRLRRRRRAGHVHHPPCCSGTSWCGAS